MGIGYLFQINLHTGCKFLTRFLNNKIVTRIFNLYFTFRFLLARFRFNSFVFSFYQSFQFILKVKFIRYTTLCSQFILYWTHWYTCQYILFKQVLYQHMESIYFLQSTYSPAHFFCQSFASVITSSFPKYVSAIKRKSIYFKLIKYFYGYDIFAVYISEFKFHKNWSYRSTGSRRHPPIRDQNTSYRIYWMDDWSHWTLASAQQWASVYDKFFSIHLYLNNFLVALYKMWQYHCAM